MFIGRAPQRVDLATAGSAPLAGIAAIMAIDAFELSDGDTVLIVGATGGVGSFAVQLAVRAGATVVAPALPEDVTYLRELGVSELLSRDGDLAAAAREHHPDGFEPVLDLVNYAPGVPATLVKDGGRVASPTGAAGEGPGRTMVMAAPTPENLERLARLLADGTLRVPRPGDLRARAGPRRAQRARHHPHPGQALAPHPMTQLDTSSLHIAVFDKANAASGNGLRGEGRLRRRQRHRLRQGSWRRVASSDNEEWSLEPGVRAPARQPRTERGGQALRLISGGGGVEQEIDDYRYRLVLWGRHVRAEAAREPRRHGQRLADVAKAGNEGWSLHGRAPALPVLADPLRIRTGQWRVGR
jgi:hypothetical protein